MSSVLVVLLLKTLCVRFGFIVLSFQFVVINRLMSNVMFNIAILNIIFSSMPRHLILIIWEVGVMMYIHT